MNVVINNNIFKVIPLFTSKDIQQGMMGKKFDGSFDGMLFFMDKGPHSFWMKNCLVSLDIIFIDENKIKHITETNQWEDVIKTILDDYNKVFKINNND